MRAATATLAVLALLVCGQIAYAHEGTVDAASASAFVPQTAADILPTSGTTDPAILATIPPLDAQPTDGIQAASVLSSAAVPQKLIVSDSNVVSEAGAAAQDAGGAPNTAKGRPIRINRRQYTQALAALQKADAAAAAEGRVSAQAAATPALQAVLAEHNIYRARHSAPAMTWDDAAAAGAAAYAARCIWQHDANRGPYGENLFATSMKDANAALSQTTKAWYGEVSTYINYQNPDMTKFGQWGHFTQVVWVSSTRLGCAAQVCPNGLAGAPGLFTIVVCRYAPPGNYVGQFPANVKPPSAVPPPPTGETTLQENFFLNSGTVKGGRGCLNSQNGRYKFCIQTDANLVLYNGSNAPVWASNTLNRATALPLGAWMRPNGQLTLFDARQTAGIYWAAGPTGTNNPYRLVVQNDGNVVIYGRNGPTWATNTAGR